jgi:catechol 2,3-dioxygenase-like lactoylglutathione lyase family enzyme
MPTSLAFYRDKLGFKVTGDSGQGDESGWAMLELGEETIMLNTAYEDGERPETPDPHASPRTPTRASTSDVRTSTRRSST